MSKYAIDISQFNGGIDFNKVKASGIDTVIIRVGGRFGGSGKLYQDSNALTNLTNAKASKMNIGIYFFTQAINELEAQEEARWTIDFIKKFKDVINLPIYIDTEYLEDCRHNNLTRDKRTSVVKAFCEEIKKNGYQAGIYGSTSWLNNNLNMSLLPYSIWVAQYYKECQYKGSYDIWQFTSEAKVSGINGNVDKNIIYKDFNKKEATYPDKIKVKACDVILGKYGNGEERVKKLGADYKEVQSLVNEMLGRLGIL